MHLGSSYIDVNIIEHQYWPVLFIAKVYLTMWGHYCGNHNTYIVDFFSGLFIMGSSVTGMTVNITILCNLMIVCKNAP